MFWQILCHSKAKFFIYSLVFLDFRFDLIFVVFGLKMECQVEKMSIFDTCCYSLSIVTGRMRKPPKLLARFVLCTEKILCQKERLNGGFHASKTKKFNLKDAARSGRPVGYDKDRFNQLLHENPRQSTRELAEQLTCDQKTSEPPSFYGESPKTRRMGSTR